MVANEKSPKIPIILNCIFCNYNTSNKKDYNKHLTTAKHLRLTNANENPQKSQEDITYICKCGKTYKHMSSLCKHKNNCEITKIETQINEKDVSDKELLL